MEIAVQHAAFTGRKLSIRTASFFAGPKLLVDGREIKGRRGNYDVPDDAGAVRQVKVKYSPFDPVPVLNVDGEKIQLARPIGWYEYAWMGIPILLVFGGGALGAALGIGAVYSSSRIFRGQRSVPAKYALSGLISAGATITFLILASILHILIYGIPKQ
jgi:hypothetical protein